MNNNISKTNKVLTLLFSFLSVIFIIIMKSLYAFSHTGIIHSDFYDCVFITYKYALVSGTGNR